MTKYHRSKLESWASKEIPGMSHPNTPIRTTPTAEIHPTTPATPDSTLKASGTSINPEPLMKGVSRDSLWIPEGREITILWIGLVMEFLGRRKLIITRQEMCRSRRRIPPLMLWTESKNSKASIRRSSRCLPTKGSPPSAPSSPEPPTSPKETNRPTLLPRRWHPCSRTKIPLLKVKLVQLPIKIERPSSWRNIKQLARTRKFLREKRKRTMFLSRKENKSVLVLKVTWRRKLLRKGLRKGRITKRKCLNLPIIPTKLTKKLPLNHMSHPPKERPTLHPQK